MARGKTASGRLSPVDTLKIARSALAALEGANAPVVVNERRGYCSPDFESLREAPSLHLIFDGRNLHDKRTIATFGLECHGITRLIAAPMN